jgi:hypothetical protein
MFHAWFALSCKPCYNNHRKETTMNYANMSDDALYELQDELWNKAVRCKTAIGYYTHREKLDEVEAEMYTRKLIDPREED